jgi:hypothetical protein
LIDWQNLIKILTTTKWPNTDAIDSNKKYLFVTICFCHRGGNITQFRGRRDLVKQDEEFVAVNYSGCVMFEFQIGDKICYCRISQTIGSIHNFIAYFYCIHIFCLLFATLIPNKQNEICEACIFVLKFQI